MYLFRQTLTLPAAHDYYGSEAGVVTSASAIALFVNGHQVTYTRLSAARYAITQYLHAGRNVVGVYAQPAPRCNALNVTVIARAAGVRATAAGQDAVAVRAWVTPGTMPYNFYPTLYARTTPGAACAADVHYSTGRPPTSFSGTRQVAGRDGTVHWGWHEMTKGDSGTATVWCTDGSVRRRAQARFSVVR